MQMIQMNKHTDENIQFYINAMETINSYKEELKVMNCSLTTQRMDITNMTIQIKEMMEHIRVFSEASNVDTNEK